MKKVTKLFAASLLRVAFTLSAQSPVNIPGEQPNTGQSTPNMGEIDGAAARGSLRQPFNGGVIVPAWMYAAMQRGEAAEHYPEAGAQVISIGTVMAPQVVPGYQRMNMSTGETSGEVFSTVYTETGGGTTTTNPYSGIDPSSMYGGTDPNGGGNDPYGNPYGGMDPGSMYGGGEEGGSDPYACLFDPSQSPRDATVAGVRGSA